jgi:hypothetical protein
VETRLAEELGSREPRLTRSPAISSARAASASGRPSCCSSRTPRPGGRPARRDDVIEAAVALELIHSATLLHDDIIDGGELRRGKPSALAVYGLGATLVAGDFLFCRAFALCARFEAEVIRWAAEACVALTEGEILQGRFRRNPAVTVADYVEIIDRKTSSLFAAGARTAAHLAGASPDVVDAMRVVRHARRPRVPDAGRSPRRRGHERAHRQAARPRSPRRKPSLPIVLALESDRRGPRVFALERPTPAGRRDGPRAHPSHRASADDRRTGRRRARDAVAAIGTLPPSDARDRARRAGADARGTGEIIRGSLRDPRLAPVRAALTRRAPMGVALAARRAALRRSLPSSLTSLIGVPKMPPMPRDGFGREIDYLRISLTDHCNLRCVYCMPRRV